MRATVRKRPRWRQQGLRRHCTSVGWFAQAAGATAAAQSNGTGKAEFAEPAHFS